MPITESVGGTVWKRKIVEIRAARDALADGRWVKAKTIRNLPDVPVQPETLLRMELQMSERPVDLTEITRVILSDPGAALQVVRLAGREYRPDARTWGRIEECIVDLGLQACFEAMSNIVATECVSKAELYDLWAHSREIANVCQMLAYQTPRCNRANDAYLVGLFHDLGALPAILAWDREKEISNDQSLAGLQIAEAWKLPVCVVEYFYDRLTQSISFEWIRLVDRAHDRARAIKDRRL